MVATPNGRISQDLIQAPSRALHVPALDPTKAVLHRNIQISLGDLIDFIIAQVDAGTGGVQAIATSLGLLTDPPGNSITAGHSGTIYPQYGSSANTFAEGNDSRIVNALDRTGDTMTGLLGFDYATAIVAAGTNNQGAATAITHQWNRVATVASTAGVRLPASVIAKPIFIRNDGANPLYVWPHTGAAFNGGSANAALLLPVGTPQIFIARDSTHWETFI